MVLRLLVVQHHVWAYLHLLLKKETLTADISWTIKAIISHYYYKSSLIAKTFACAEKKISRLVLRHML
jgi:hypothetical protein